MTDALRVPCPACHVDAGAPCIGLCVPAPRDPHEARIAHALYVVRLRETEPAPAAAVFGSVPARVGPRRARMAHALDRSVELVGHLLASSTFRSITDNVQPEAPL